MAAVLVALKQLAIAEKDLRTNNYAVAFEPEPNPPAPQPSAAPAEANTPKPPRGVYRVSNSVTVTIRDLKSVGRVIRAATDAGANDFWGLSFELENDSALVSRARELAVIDAKHAAEELAKLAGVTLGEIVSISEGEPTPAESVNAYALRPAAEPEVPVEHGQVTVSYPVQIVYTTVRP
jgi:uncharacterized protein YggE